MALTQISSDGIKNGEIKSGDIADDAVGQNAIGDNAVFNTHMADDAIGIDELSATGTPSSSTFLRGDNSWVTPTDTVYTHPNHSGDVTSSADGATTIADNAVTLAKMAGGTDGQIITYDASGDPVAVGPGTDGQVLTSTGAGSPPAFEDIPAAGAALTGSTNNTICTVTGANAIQGEANLTFDGTDLATTGRIAGGGAAFSDATAGHDDLVLKTSGSTGMTLVSGDTSNGTIAFADGTSGNAFYRGYFQYNHNTDLMSVGIGGGTMMEWTNANVKINDGDLVIGTAGHGIDFSAVSHAGGMTSELLDSYEEGTWTPSFNALSTGSVSVTSAGYTKVGRLVHVQGYVTVNSTSTNDFEMSMPFTMIGGSQYAPMSVQIGANTTASVLRVNSGSSQAFCRNQVNGDSVRRYTDLNGGLVIFSGTYMTA